MDYLGQNEYDTLETFVIAKCSEEAWADIMRLKPSGTVKSSVAVSDLKIETLRELQRKLPTSPLSLGGLSVRRLPRIQSYVSAALAWKENRRVDVYPDFYPKLLRSLLHHNANITLRKSSMGKTAHDHQRFLSLETLGNVEFDPDDMWRGGRIIIIGRWQDLVNVLAGATFTINEGYTEDDGSQIHVLAQCGETYVQPTSGEVVDADPAAEVGKAVASRAIKTATFAANPDVDWLKAAGKHGGLATKFVETDQLVDMVANLFSTRKTFYTIQIWYQPMEEETFVIEDGSCTGAEIINELVQWRNSELGEATATS